MLNDLDLAVLLAGPPWGVVGVADGRLLPYVADRLVVSHGVIDRFVAGCEYQQCVHCHGILLLPRRPTERSSSWQPRSSDPGADRVVSLFVVLSSRRCNFF